MIYRYVIPFPKSPFSVSVSFFQTAMHLQTESPQDVRLWLVTAQNLLGKVFQSRDKDGCTPNVRVPMVFIVSSRDSWNILGKHLSSIPFRIFPEQINHHGCDSCDKKNLQKLWVNFQPTLNPKKIPGTETHRKPRASPREILGAKPPGSTVVCHGWRQRRTAPGKASAKGKTPLKRKKTIIKISFGLKKRKKNSFEKKILIIWR